MGRLEVVRKMTGLGVDDNGDEDRDNEDEDDDGYASIDLKQVSNAGVTRNQFGRHTTFDDIFPS